MLHEALEKGVRLECDLWIKSAHIGRDNARDTDLQWDMMKQKPALRQAVHGLRSTQTTKRSMWRRALADP